MILIDSLLYKMDQRLNKLSTNAHQQIQLEDKILILNEAQLKLIKTKMDGFSIATKLGFDAFKKRYEDLQKLVVPHGVTPLELKKVNNKLNQWSADLEKLKPRYMFYVDSYVIADKGRCKNRIIYVNNDLTKHGDIAVLLNNEHYRPSFEYQETFNILSSEDISIFTDGEFIPKELHVSYIRYPIFMDKKGYNHFDGSPSENVDCELEDYLEDELLDLAVELTAQYTENASAFQSAQYRIRTNE